MHGYGGWLVVVAAIGCGGSNDDTVATTEPTTAPMESSSSGGSESSDPTGPLEGSPGDDTNCPSPQTEVLELSEEEIAAVLGANVTVTDDNCADVCEMYKDVAPPAFAGCEIVPLAAGDASERVLVDAVEGERTDTTGEPDESDGTAGGGDSTAGTTNDSSSSDDAAGGGGPATISCTWWYSCM